MHHSDHFVSADLERCTGVHGSGGRHTQPDDRRQRFLSDKITSGQKGDCGFFAPLRDNGDSCTASLQIEHGVSRVSLAEKCLLWFQLNHGSAEPGVCKKGRGIEFSDFLALQNATSLQAGCLGGRFMPKEQPLRCALNGVLANRSKPVNAMLEN